MKTEQENCTVTVRGIQRVEGDDDVVELVPGGRRQPGHPRTHRGITVT